MIPAVRRGGAIGPEEPISPPVLEEFTPPPDMNNYLPSDLTSERGRRASALQNRFIAIREEQAEESHIEALKSYGSGSSSVKSFTLRIIMKLTGSLFQSLLSLFACVVYVVNTYYEDDSETEDTFFIFEVVIAVLFSFDYGFGMYSARDKKKFMLNPLNILDLMTILPVFISMLGQAEASGSFAFARLLRVIRVIRILRLYRLFTSTRDVDQQQDNTSPVFDSSEISRQIMIIVSTILALIFISTGIVHSLQKTEDFEIGFSVDESELTFENAFYFMIITITTVGYGDMAPATNLARAIIGIFLIVVIVVMTQQTGRLSDLMKRNSQYRRPYKGDPGKHVIVAGSFNGTTLYRFLKEFYHPDHDMPMRKCKVLLVRDETPNKEILAIINHPIYEEAVKYLEGDFMRESTLKDSQVKESRGVFILTNQYDDDVVSSDTFAILASSAVKEFSPHTPVFLQLVRPELLIHHYWAGWETGFSTWKLKLSLLAANAFISGFSTLISNLVISSSGVMKKEAEKCHWINEYVMGLSNEMYLVDFPEHLHGVNFSEISKALYLKHNSLLFGVQSKMTFDEDNEDLYSEIYLNPVEYYIKKTDCAFIIAPNIEAARGIDELQIKDMDEPIMSQDYRNIMNTLKSPAIKISNRKQFDSNHFIMYDRDLRGYLWDHILIFGRFEHLEIVLETFNLITKQVICFISDHSPDDRWIRLSRFYPDVLYLECSLSDVEELSHTAINFAYHVILLSSRIPGSTMEDSGILPIASLIENNFSCPFTVELVDESNLIYLDKKPPIELENLPYVTWPRYTASNVFFSSALDFIIAGGFHNNFIIDVVQRLIIYEDLFAETGVDENYRINSIELPNQLHGKITYGEAMCYFLNLPRPVVCLGLYRGLGSLDNLTPYVYTKPDPNTPLFSGDRFILLGETQSREVSPLLRSMQHRKHQDTVEFGKKRSITKKSSARLKVVRETIAEQAGKMAEEDERDDYYSYSDHELIEKLQNLLNETAQERNYLSQQNQALLTLVDEYNTVKKLLMGQTVSQLEAENHLLTGLSDDEIQQKHIQNGIEVLAQFRAQVLAYQTAVEADNWGFDRFYLKRNLEIGGY